MTLQRLTGKWLQKNLLLVVRAINGKKEILVYGRLSSDSELKKTMDKLGFVWEPSNQRWSLTIPRKHKTPLVD